MSVNTAEVNPHQAHLDQPIYKHIFAVIAGVDSISHQGQSSTTISFAQFAAWWARTTAAAEQFLDGSLAIEHVQLGLEEVHSAWEQQRRQQQQRQPQQEASLLDASALGAVLVTAARLDWKERHDPSHDANFFFDAATGGSHWELPEGAQAVREILERAFEHPAAQPTGFTPNPALEMGGEDAAADQAESTESEPPVVSRRRRETSEAQSYSDAAASPFYPELGAVGRLLSFMTGRASLAYRAIQAFLVLVGAALAIILPGTYAEAVGWTAPNAMLRVSCACVGLGWVCALYPLADVRRCLHPGKPAAQDTGDHHPDDDDRLMALKKLGAGTTRITEADARSLNRWRRALVGFGGLFLVPLGVLFGIVVPIVLVASGSSTTTAALVQVVVIFVGVGLTVAIVVPILLFGWGISMKVAAALVNDEILEVIIQMEQVSPADDDAWQSKVVEPALALDGTLRRLSDGWGAGLASLTMACWAVALGGFTTALNTPLMVALGDLRGIPPGTLQTIYLVVTSVVAVLPLFIGLDLAAISTRCDVMMTALNNVRLRHGETYHLRVTWLETCLQRLNGGQGPGFTARFFFNLDDSDLDTGTVLNTEKLKKTGASLITAFAAVATYLIGIADEAATNQEDTNAGNCGLGAEDYALVETCSTLCHTQVQNFNSSCMYNWTVG